MAKHLLISIAELKSRQRFTAWIGQEEVLIVMTPEGVRAYSGMCPHQGGPLGEGIFQNNKVTCPWHGCTFDLNQGGCTDMGTCRNVSGMKLRPLNFSIGTDNNLYLETSS